MRTIPQYGDVLSKAEAAARLGVSERCIESWTYLGLRGKTLPRLQIGCRFFYLPADLDEFVRRVKLPGEPVEQPVEDASKIDEAVLRDLRRQGFKI